MKDFYKILGITKESTSEEMKKSYRTLSKKYHPDTGEGDEEKFKEISEAYSVLSDPKQKSKYDNGGTDFDFGDIFGNSGFGFNFGDIFGHGQQRKSQRRGSDIKIQIPLTLDEIEIGIKKDIKYNRQVICDPCNGDGGSGSTSCTTCNGKGRIIRTTRTPIGVMQQESMCNNCGGSGKIVKNVCKICHGEGKKTIVENLSIETPIGAMDNVMYKYTNKGNGNKYGIGDLLVQFTIKPHKYFKRQEYDLIYDISIPFNTLISGGNIQFIGLNNKKHDVTIPPMSNPGYILHLRKQGLPYMDIPNMKGDIILNLIVDFPTNLSSEELEIINNLNNKENFIYKQK